MGIRTEDVLRVIVGLLGFGAEQVEGQQAGEQAEQLHGGGTIRNLPVA
jgi:hypothetical protein